MSGEAGGCVSNWRPLIHVKEQNIRRSNSLTFRTSSNSFSRPNCSKTDQAIACDYFIRTYQSDGKSKLHEPISGCNFEPRYKLKRVNTIPRRSRTSSPHGILLMLTIWWRGADADILINLFSGHMRIGILRLDFWTGAVERVRMAFWTKIGKTLSTIVARTCGTSLRTSCTGIGRFCTIACKSSNGPPSNGTWPRPTNSVQNRMPSE